MWSLKDKNIALNARYADSGNAEAEDKFFFFLSCRVWSIFFSLPLLSPKFHFLKYLFHYFLLYIK